MFCLRDSSHVLRNPQTPGFCCLWTTFGAIVSSPLSNHRFSVDVLSLGQIVPIGGIICSNLICALRSEWSDKPIVWLLRAAEVWQFANKKSILLAFVGSWLWDEKCVGPKPSQISRNPSTLILWRNSNSLFPPLSSKLKSPPTIVLMCGESKWIKVLSCSFLTPD